ncbi:hypothetical protein TanjilG_19937 [Lupinus angustifolius]|uniref:Uncharacterized protein n=1 Tax=Lupinus angustifolius TaxID=3871 RepID=A0A1J7HIK8_LUPAN|nr:hypothetical protein TanjilG_19937 [Lupinus angustifolius]
MCAGCFLDLSLKEKGFVTYGDNNKDMNKEPFAATQGEYSGHASQEPALDKLTLMLWNNVSIIGCTSIFSISRIHIIRIWNILRNVRMHRLTTISNPCGTIFSLLLSLRIKE